MNLVKKFLISLSFILFLYLSINAGFLYFIYNSIVAILEHEQVLAATLISEVGIIDNSDDIIEVHIIDEVIDVEIEISEDETEPSPSTSYDDTNIVETTIYSGLSLSNSTSLDINISDLTGATPSFAIEADSDEPQILIIHTHGTEAYTPTSFDSYEISDSYRTTDYDYNMIRVGDELTEAFLSYGINTIHDRELYDYPSYTGSYSRSMEAIEAYLETYPSIKIVIDVHRDALGDETVTYKTMAEIDGVTSSQLMILVGTDQSGLYHPNWTENLNLAVFMQEALIAKYPTLSRPLALVNERYNQHLTTGSIILEVGTNGNSLDEALTAVKLFADAVAPALLSLS